jgi:hypothetical protein
VIRDNAALIGGLGVAIGAIIAASLPDTKAEGALMGKASDDVKGAAAKTVQSGGAIIVLPIYGFFAGRRRTI